MTREEVLKTAIERYGTSAQTDMMIEEMSELTKALLKWRRSDGTNVQLLKDVCEEMTDVQIMLDQMKMIYGSTDRFENFKITRLAERLGIGDRV